MTRFIVPALSALLAGTALIAAPQEPKFRGGTHMVSVYATVVDQYGRLIPNLTKDDFEVFDDGRRQGIAVFANDVRPITVVMMLDRSGSIATQFKLVRDAAEHFVAQLLPADRARIGSFSNEVRLDPDRFTSSREELVGILRDGLQPAGATPLWAATSRAMDALSREEGRRVVLLFTDGKDNPPQAYADTKFAEVRARAQTEEIMIYGIGLSERCDDGSDGRRPRFENGDQRGPTRGLPPGGMPRPPIVTGGGKIGDGRIGGGRGTPPIWWPGDRSPVTRGGCLSAGPDPDLKDLAGVGGGGYFELTNTADLQTTFKRVADELHHQYLLAFPAEVLDNRLHTISVKVTIPGLTARARKGYFAAMK